MKRDIGHFFDWLVAKGLTEATARQYVKVVRAATMGNTVAGSNAVQPELVLQPHLASSTLVTRRAALKRWAIFIKDEALLKALSSNATTALVGRGVAQKRHPQPLSDAEYDAFLGVLDKARAKLEPWVWPVLRLIAILGLRAGQDALQLRRADINEGLRTNDKFLVTVKGGCQRWLPVAPVKAELEALASIKSPTWDVVSDLLGVGRLAAYNRVYRAIAAVAAEAGIERMHPHRLRHTAAMRLYERSGHDIVLVQTLLGHRSVTTTQRYLAGDRLDELGSMLGPNEEV